jgi:hypothetical protein
MAANPPLPADHIIARVFHFSILLPFLRLDERLSHNIAIDPENNDVCLMAADICVSCYHLIEQVRDGSPELAQRLMEYEHWQIIGDIANTRKHYIRNNPRRQVRLGANLLYEVNEQNHFAFLETEPVAVTADGVGYNISNLIVDFIDHLIMVTGINNGTQLTPLAERRPVEFDERITLRITPETSTASQTRFRMVRRAADDELIPVLELEMPAPRMVLDVPDAITTGRYQLRFDRNQLQAITDENNAHDGMVRIGGVAPG